MAYAAKTDIDASYGEDLLYQVAPSADGVDLVKVAQALADASDEVDMSLRGHYRLPLDPVPSVVRRWVIDIALSMLPADGAAGSDLVTDRAKAARQALKDLRTGATSLGLPQVPAGTPGGNRLAQAEKPDTVFSADALRGY